MKTVADVINFGRQSYYAGRLGDYSEAVRSLGCCIRDLANADKVEEALSVESYWYNQLVKLVESEEAYHDAFQWHYRALWEAGLRDRKTLPANDANGVCFVIPVGVLLGHTEVMLQIIRSWREAGDPVELCVVSLSSFDGRLNLLLSALGVKFFSPPAGLNSVRSRAEWCRRTISTIGCRTAVWVSVPVMVSYLYGFGVAPRQVFWSLKFHPVHLGESVTHIAMTPPGDGEAIFHGGRWTRFCPPLSIPDSPIQDVEVSRVRAEFGSKFFFGALARTEKFNSVEYVDTVVEIIKCCPGSVFLYSGREDSPIIRSRFTEAGLVNSIRFIGWVDTGLYTRVIDVFLETFPFGCGVTGAQAVNSGTRMVSLWRKDTLARFYFKSLSEARALTPRWCIETEVHEYRQRAVEFFSQGSVPKVELSSGVLAALDQEKALRFRDLIS